jgi:hypothetical protein
LEARISLQDCVCLYSWENIFVYGAVLNNSLANDGFYFSAGGLILTLKIDFSFRDVYRQLAKTALNYLRR